MLKFLNQLTTRNTSIVSSDRPDVWKMRVVRIRSQWIGSSHRLQRFQKLHVSVHHQIIELPLVDLLRLNGALIHVFIGIANDCALIAEGEIVRSQLFREQESVRGSLNLAE